MNEMIVSQLLLNSLTSWLLSLRHTLQSAIHPFPASVGVAVIKNDPMQRAAPIDVVEFEISCLLVIRMLPLALED